MEPLLCRKRWVYWKIECPRRRPGIFFKQQVLKFEVILNLVADKFAACKDMDEVKEAIEDVREMAKKEKPAE